MSKASIDTDSVRTLAQLLDETNLTEIEYDTGTLRIRVARQGVPMVAAPVAAPVVVAAAPALPGHAHDDHANHPGVVKSPMVGIAYLRPDPQAPAFISVGDTVSEGQTLMLIEAMKTFNPIRATKGGKVTRIWISDGTPVEFDEPLLVVE